VFAGTDTCTSGVFQISLDLTPGDNLLQAQDYNITNAPGPASPPVTVTYTPPVSPTPPPRNPSINTAPSSTTASSVAVPSELLVTQVDTTVPYTSPDATPSVSYIPTLAGIAPPYSKVVIMLHPNDYTCTTYANTQGYWRCQLPYNLPDAIYTVDVTATTLRGTPLTFPPFMVKAVGRAPSAMPVPLPFRITSSYTYSVHTVGQVVGYTLHLIGGIAPYAFTVAWGDGTIQTMSRSSNEDFAISHRYSWIASPQATKLVRVQALDSMGRASTLQMTTLLRNPTYHSVIAGITRSSGLWGLFTKLRPLLWLGYLIVILLVLSFWLGEREELVRA
jgi:hypothetical protein